MAKKKLTSKVKKVIKKAVKKATEKPDKPPKLNLDLCKEINCPHDTGSSDSCKKFQSRKDCKYLQKYS